MTYQIASISEQGWINDPSIILNYAFTCYMLTDAAQTLVYQNNLISLPYTYHLYINDPEQMAIAMQSDLTKLLQRYFQQVDVRTQAKEISGKHYAVLLSAAVMTEQNEKIELSKVMEIDSNNLRKIIEVNNYGDGQDLLGNL